jgi:hypothetical protein
VRFLFYELEQQGHVSKRSKNLDGTDSKRKPDQNLIDAVTVLREAGLIPWDWIVDESRDVTTWTFAPSVRDYLVNEVGQGTLDRFPDVRRPVLVCESRGVGGVLSRGVATDYLVSVVPTGGQCHGFLMTKAASPLYDRRGVHVLYVGDFDLSGDLIESNTRSVLERANGCRFYDELRTGANYWERLALTKEQCKRLKKKGIEPIRKHDKRYKDGRPHEAFEVEALGQSLVTQIVRDRLEELAPEPLASVLEREEEERDEARQQFEQWD